MLADPNIAKMAMEAHMGSDAAEKEKEPEPEASIAKMDEAGIDMARLLGIEPIKRTK